MLYALVLTSLLAAPPAPAMAPPVWRIDAVHSEITFRIRHMVGRVSGDFREFSGTVTGSPPTWADGKVEVDVKVASIDTRVPRRDDHLRSENFFNVAKYPGMKFTSTKVTVSGRQLVIAGNLTLKGVTKPVTLRGEYLGDAMTTNGRRVGFHASGVIKRADFGITWNQALDDGSTVLGEDVELELNIEAVSQ